MDMLQNNLKAMVDAFKREHTDESVKTVAAKKGVTPETVSRHMHSKIDMSMSDINDYAMILGCTEYDILFQNPPVPLLAAILPWDKNTDEYFTTDMPDSKIPTSNNGEKPRLFIAHEWSTERTKRFENKSVYLHDYYKDEVMAVYWDQSCDLPQINVMLAGAIQIVDAEPLRTKTISKDCFGYFSYAMTTDGELLYGILYQSGKNNYTMESIDFGTLTNLQLLWAAPSLMFIERADLRGVKIVERPTPKLKEVIGTKVRGGI